MDWKLQTDKATNQPPMFVGLLLMHQHKDWKTCSRFVNSLIAEKMELDALLAYRTDGKKELIDGFQRNIFVLFHLFQRKYKDRT